MGPETQQQLSDFVGEHGPYQLILTLILFIRYVLLGLMANSGSLMAPDVTFYCDLPMEEIVAIMPNITLLNKTEQELEIREEFKQICQLDLHLYQQAYLNATLTLDSPTTLPVGQQSTVGKGAGGGGIAQNASLAAQLKRQARLNMTTRIRECTDFRYDIAPDQGRTMTSEFDLVCERDWLRSLFQSLISAAIVVAHVFWGTFSDNYGRYKAQKICLLVSLLSGILSVCPIDFWTFTIARALCSFGDLGLVVSLTTTVVELVGNQYRGLSVALVNFGYALGVTLLPYIVAYLEDFRQVIGFTVFCHFLSIPFILATNESVRWLLTNRKFKLARRELKRIARFNRGTQYCCSVWPVNKLIKRTKYGQLSQKNRKISSLESRQAFDLLFKKFIEQIESQKLCDPEQADDLVEFDNNNNNNNKRSECESNTTGGSPNETSIGAGASADLDAVVVLSGGNGSGDARTAVTIEPSNNTTNGFTRGIQETIDGGEDVNLLPSYQVVEQATSRPDRRLIEQGNTKIGIDHTLSLKASTRSNSCGQLLVSQLCQNDDLPGKSNQTMREVARRKSSSTGFLTAAAAATQHTLPNIEQQQCNSRFLMPQLEFRRANELEKVFMNGGGDVIVKRRQDCQPDCINLVAHQLSFMGRVSRLFKDKILMIAVFTIVWTTFNSELQYTSFIIINLEVGEDVYLNYILGGCMEALAAITASLLLSYASRRHSLICFWLLISASCFGLSWAHIDSTWAVWLLALAKFSQSCLSSIASVAAYEAFPTFLRQSGSGLVFTLGGLGSVFAPLIFAEFDDHAGMDRVLMTFSFSSLTAATLIYLFLKETRNCELQ